jgi:hypothetical protein
LSQCVCEAACVQRGCRCACLLMHVLARGRGDTGELDMREVKQALIALEVDEDELVGWGEKGSSTSALMQAMDTNNDGKISLEELSAAVRTQCYYGIQVCCPDCLILCT